MTKTFILDTNVLLHDPKAIFAFEDNEVVIPLIVLDELDRHKSGRTQTSAHARQVIRSLDELRATGNISHGVKTNLGGYIRVELNYAENVPPNLDATRADNRIIGVALGIKEAYKERRDVRVITKDINLRVKCDALQVPSEDYNSDAVVRNLNDLYSGNTVIDVDADDVGRMYNEGFIEVKNIVRPLYPNEYVLVRSNIDPKHTCLGRFDGLNIVRVTPVKNVWSISPRNKEQVFAFDALFNPDVKLATITGIAGCGKTLIAASAGISQLFDKNLYKRIVLTRPIVPMGGKDIGFLPGDKSEKLQPWMGPLYDNLDLIFSERGRYLLDSSMNEGVIQVEAMTYIRGRSMPNSYIICDEAQNLTRHEIKTLITRVGEGSKVVLTGDVQQIDTPYLDSSDNGLT